MGLEKLVGRVREKVREHKIRRQLEEIEKVYLEDIPPKTVNHAEKSKKNARRGEKKLGKKRKSVGWDSLDEYFK